MANSLHLYVHGLVQGVGFRFATRAEMARLGIDGWVRNLDDGRVEAFFKGDAAKLTQMLEWCRRGPSLARVDKVEARWEVEDPR